MAGVAFALLCLLGGGASTANAEFYDHPDRSAWTTDQSVSAILPTAWGAYIGGDFDYLGPQTGGLAELDVSSGSLEDGMPDLVAGPWSPKAVVPDGDGGWYAAGNLQRVDGVDRGNLIHIDPDGAVDEDFPVLQETYVEELALSPDEATLYVTATDVYGEAEIAFAVDVASSQLRGLDESCGTSAIGVSPDGDRLYIGGEAGLCELDAASGELVETQPTAEVGRVAGLLVSGDSIYVGSAGAGGVPPVSGPSGVYRVDRSTGLTVWYSSLHGDWPTDLALSSDQKVYVNARGPDTPGLARLETQSGAVDEGWTPPIPDDTSPMSIELSPDQGELIAAGEAGTPPPVTPEGSVDGDYVAAFSTFGDGDVAWRQRASAPPMDVGVDEERDRVATGGHFTSVGGVKRESIAAVDESGKPLPWRPTGFTRIFDIGLKPDGSSVYVTGWLDANGTRDRLAEIRAADAGRTGWASNIVGGTSLDVAPGGTVYATDSTFIEQGDRRRNIAAISPSGQLLEWGRRIRGGVGDPLTNPGRGTIYVSGSFQDPSAPLESEPYGPVTELSLLTGEITSWNPTIENAGDIELSPSGDLLYVSSSTSVDGSSPVGGRPLALRTTDASPTGYRPRVWEDAGHLAITPGGNRVYLGGSIRRQGFPGAETGVNGEPRDGAAGTFATDGSPTSWNPGFGSPPSSDWIGAIEISPTGDTLWLSSNSPEIGAWSSGGLSLFRDPDPDGPADPAVPPADLPGTAKDPSRSKAPRWKKCAKKKTKRARKRCRKAKRRR
jgi:hypothetical protein